MLISLLMNLGMFGGTSAAGGKGDNSEDGASSSTRKRQRTIIKPTGIIDRPRSVPPAPSIPARVEQPREIARAAPVTTVPSALITRRMPVSLMTPSDRDAEIAMLMKEKMRMDDEDAMQIILMAADL